jgi:hypothetical protein
MTTTIITVDRATGTLDRTTSADLNFVLQQGLDAPEPSRAARLSSALRFQPRVIGLILGTGVISQSPTVFAMLAALLWWSALWPRLNPFDYVYNHTLGLRSGAPMLGPAPMPRRFAQGMAAACATASAATLASGVWTAAWAVQAFFILAVAALVFGRFCLGSFVYHLVHGRVAFALASLPWKRDARAEHDGCAICLVHSGD